MKPASEIISTTIDRATFFALGVIAVVAILGPFVIVAAQALGWLANGVWIPAPVSGAIKVFDPDLPAQMQSTTWLGLNQIVAFFLDIWIGFYLWVLAWLVIRLRKALGWI